MDVQHNEIHTFRNHLVEAYIYCKGLIIPMMCTRKWRRRHLDKQFEAECRPGLAC